MVGILDFVACGGRSLLLFVRDECDRILHCCLLYVLVVVSECVSSFVSFFSLIHTFVGLHSLLVL